MLERKKEDTAFTSAFPQKQVGACALITYKNEILIVQPSFHSQWILPGGTMEAEESPLEGLQRELFTKLNLSAEITNLIAIDYVPSLDGKKEYLQLFFACRDLLEEQAQNLRLNPYKLQDFRFVTFEKALQILTPGVARRLESSLTAQTQGAVYLENGRAIMKLISRSERPQHNHG